MLKKKSLTCLVLLYACLITACQASHTTKDYDYYLLHPKQLEQDFIRCRTSQLQDSSCQEITRAADTVRRLALQLAFDQEAYGLRIMKAQYRLTRLKQQLQVEDPSKAAGLRKKVQQLELNIASRLAVIRLLMEP